MYKIYVDPYLLVYPQANSGIDEFENYILSLISWSEEIEKIKEANLATLYLSAKTPEILAITNGYPERNELEKLIVDLNLQNVIQTHDILILIESFLKLPSIEDRLNINAILIDNIQYDPVFYLDGRNELFVQIYYELTVLIFLLCKIENLANKHQIIVTRYIQAENTQVLIECEIVDCEFSTNSCYVNIPCDVSIRLQSFVNPNSLHDYFDASDIWINANYCEGVYKKAISIFVAQKNKQLETPKTIDELTYWLFGSRFLKSLKYLGFLDEPIKTKMLLRTCAEIILKENMGDTHWLRTGKGANNPQKKRKKDGAKAWRRDIDHEYHLHYWEIERGIEFASVVVHNDLKIPE
ncbi:hypothetical protein [Nostoc sp.]|uniref:hypothetical protein n=1 Tax=Nostoc sp. TaxID=1180 RepID=UPI002FF7D232